MMGDGDTFCCLPALDGGPYPATATAAVPSILIRFPGSLFRDLVEEFHEFGRATLHQFCGRLRENACEGCGVPDDATAKLAARILIMYRKFGEDIPLTRRELGELAGTTVETAIRVLKEFERSGWVSLARGKVRVCDPTALEATAQGSALPVRLDYHTAIEEFETDGPVAADTD
jgi:CRP-like cAMP-binding protein